jgi:hypothetical protein
MDCVSARKHQLHCGRISLIQIEYGSATWYAMHVSFRGSYGKVNAARKTRIVAQVLASDLKAGIGGSNNPGTSLSKADPANSDETAAEKEVQEEKVEHKEYVEV